MRGIAVQLGRSKYVRMGACLFLNVFMFVPTASASGNFESGKITGFVSANGVSEQCIELAPMPKAHYSKHDRKTQSDYCSIDFSKAALCPKLWSTSPGTVIYEIDVSKFDNDYTQFEKQQCSKGHHAKDAAVKKLASFKISVNDRSTSATYAPSSWTYYHLSRYFKTGVHVPVAVYRSVDKQIHLERVVKPALSIIHGRHGLKMLGAGWSFLDAVESGQDKGSAGRAVLTGGDKLVFGSLLDNQGDRYSMTFNGTRESGWGMGQNYDFQQTAPFLALRSELPVAEAIKAGVHKARSNPKMANKLPADIEPAQVAFWMNDLLEITLLDYILGQQDRIGNIDYLWRWFWLDDGKLHSKHAKSTEVPTSLAEFRPMRLKRTAINDNDAGVRRGYANFTMKTDMLGGLRHYNPRLYKKLVHLAADMQGNGEIFQWFTKSSGLSEREISAIAERTQMAFEILVRECEAGNMKLDLDPQRFLNNSQELKPMKASSCRPQ